ncbi:uncharacterized protein FYW23_014563 isoform 2-T2 [Sylvia borin]
MAAAGGGSPPQSPPKPPQIGEGQDVLARWTDGLLYLGVVKKVDASRRGCLIQFEDNSQFFVLWKDISPAAVPGDEPSCCVCAGSSRNAENSLVRCGKCGHAYHQRCHVPPPPAGAGPWSCRRCVFAVATKLEPEDAAVLPVLAVVPRGVHSVPVQAAALRGQVLCLRVQRVPGRGRECAETAPALGGRGSPAPLPPQRLLQEEIFRPGARNSPVRQLQLGGAAAGPALGHAQGGALRAPPGGAQHPQGPVCLGPGDEEAQGALRAAQPRPSPAAPRAPAGRRRGHNRHRHRHRERRARPRPPHPDVRLLPPLGQHQPQLAHAGPGALPSPRAPPAPPPTHRGPAPFVHAPFIHTPFGPRPLGHAPPCPGAPGDPGRDRSVPARVGGRGHALTPPPPRNLGTPTKNFGVTAPKSHEILGEKKCLFWHFHRDVMEERRGAWPNLTTPPDVGPPPKI